jgi:hypothetical protein
MGCLGVQRQAGELVFASTGKAVRQGFLLVGEDVHIPGVGVLEHRQAAGVLGQAPQNHGGSSETELKLLAVIPTGSPFSARVVTMVTPVPNMPRARRKSLGSKVAAVLCMG